LVACSLDDDIWEIRFNFPGEDNLERTLCSGDITILNLIALIEGRGYGFGDNIYYVKEKGKGLEGMECVDSMEKVESMLQLFDHDKVLNLTVIKKQAEFPIGLNRDDLEAVEISDALLSVDSHGVTYISEDEQLYPVAMDYTDEELYPVAMDYTDVVYMGTQQSCNMEKGKRKACSQIVHVDVLDEDDLIWSGRNIGEYRPEDHGVGVAVEIELMKKLRREKKEAEKDPENVDIEEQLMQQKKQRQHPDQHIEGDTDVEEFYEGEDSSEEEVEEAAEEDFIPIEKKAKRVGPTTRSHHEPEEEDDNYFVPSPDEDCNSDDLPVSDDDDFVKKFALASGKKRRLKK
jgi:hypothetical protein